jgi:hypothetical protein
MFGLTKNKPQDKSKTIYSLLKSKIDDTKVHTEVLSTIIESSTFNTKLEEYNEEFLEFLNNLQTFQNFFIHNKQVSKLNILKKYIESRPKVQFLIKNTKLIEQNLNERKIELEKLKKNIELANKTDLESIN